MEENWINFSFKIATNLKKKKKKIYYKFYRKKVEILFKKFKKKTDEENWLKNRKLKKKCIRKLTNFFF